MNTLAPTFLIGSSSFLQVMRTVITSQMSSKFGQIRPWTAELAALERLKKSPLTYNGKDVVNSPALSFLIRSSSFLQVTRTTIRSQMSSKFSKVRPWTAELAALERLKKSPLTYNGKDVVNSPALSFLIRSSSFLQVTKTTIRSQMSSKFSKVRPWTAELAALERLKKSPLTYNGKDVVNSPALSFLIRSSSFLQVTRTTIRSQMSSKFSKVRPWTAELPALERLENGC